MQDNFGDYGLKRIKRKASDSFGLNLEFMHRLKRFKNDEKLPSD